VREPGYRRDLDDALQRLHKRSNVERALHVPRCQTPAAAGTEFDSSATAGPSVRCRAVAGGDEWLDVEAAARYLGFHVNTIYQMVRDGRLPALRFPVRIRREDLDTCLERCRIKPGELRHLNAYASGAHLSGEPPITRRGAPDRRFGPRTAAGLHQRSASSSLSSG
jgi:excisionase family DNA binding protein